MKAVELSPSDDWVNMVLAGTPPQSIMKSAYKGVMFWIGQKEVEAHLTTSKAMHLKQKYEEMQQKYMEKLEQIHGAYQKAMKKVQYLEHEKEGLEKDKNELQEKYTEKSRQKRKLEEMYEALRHEYEQLKRGANPACQKNQIIVKRSSQMNNLGSNSRGFNHRSAPSMGAGGNNKESFAPITPNTCADFSCRASPCSGFFDMQGVPEIRTRMPSTSPGIGLRQRHVPMSGGMSPFKQTDVGNIFTPAGGHASAALRNLLMSPMKNAVGSRPRSGLSR